MRQKGAVGRAEVDEDDVDIILKLLKQKVIAAVEKKGRDLIECFEHFDDNGDGVLDERELRDGMERLGIELSPNETRSLIDRFVDPLSALSDEPRIKYRDFVKGLNLPRKEEDSAEAEQALRNELERLAREGRDRPNFSKLFDELDSQGKGEIDRRQFCRMMEQLNIHMTGSLMNLLIQKFDTDGDGMISYNEFVEFIEGSGGAVDPDDIDEVLKRLKLKVTKAIQENGLDFVACFEHFDENGDGVLDERELRDGMEELGIELSPNETRALMERFQVGDVRDFHLFRTQPAIFARF